jgi:peptide-methionine (S)-S-oxide reductase
MSNGIETATFGGGCFWCTEALFETVPGVRRVTSGYAGGKTTGMPTYEQVCTGRTGHAEVIQVEFDSNVVSYDKLLSYFWQAHDPTTMNRQGADVGTQYRSIILYHNATQRDLAEDSKRAAQSAFEMPITTEIASLNAFYPAEQRHQNYFQRNSAAPYCMMVIRPKLSKFKVRES